MHPKFKTFFVWSFLLIGQLNFASAQYCGDRPIMLHYYESKIHDKVVDFCFHSFVYQFSSFAPNSSLFQIAKSGSGSNCFLHVAFDISWLEIYFTIRMVKECIVMKQWMKFWPRLWEHIKCILYPKIQTQLIILNRDFVSWVWILGCNVYIWYATTNRVEISFIILLHSVVQKVAWMRDERWRKSPTIPSHIR